MNYFAIPGLPSPKKEKENVLNSVCKVFGVTAEDIKSETRIRKVVDARRALIYILCSQRRFTLVEIGKFVNRGHATTIYHNREAVNMIETDKEFKQKIDGLKWLYY